MRRLTVTILLMRILIITATYPPSINGVAITTARLKKELEQNGCEVTVLAPDNPKKVKDENDVIRYPSLPNPLVKDYPVPITPSLKTVDNLLGKNKPDIVHVQHPFNVGYFSSLIAEYYKVPLVFTYHTRYDEYAESYSKFLPGKFKKSFIQNNVDNFCKQVDLIISPSTSLTNNLLKRVPYLNIATIPSGITEIPKVNLSKEELREKLDLPKNKTILLVVCRVSKEKNLSLLIKSINILNNNYFLLIVGGGNYEKQLKELAVKEGVIDKIRFVGLIEHEKLGIYYQAADLFVYPSTTETQGLILLEALSFGLPIIAVNSEASREWVFKAMGVLTENTSEDFAKGIFTINKKGLGRKPKIAMDYAKQFNVTMTTRKFLNEYEQLIKRYGLGSRLLETGWQSWSPRAKNFLLRWPALNYSPKPDDYLPDNVNKIERNKKPAVGWCSWYAFGFYISEDKIFRQSEWFSKHKEIPIKYILIDGGWVKNGDWTKADKNKFPHGIKYASSQIKDMGFKPGIWVAPFWAEPSSELFRKHPHWMSKGKIFYSDGFKGFPLDRLVIKRYIMDVRKPEVMKYIFECLDYLLFECGFELLKLDYLYSIYFIPGMSSREAGSILRNFFIEVRNRYPNVYIIACGSPLKPAVGVVDSMRIGPDVISPHLEGIPFLKNALNTYKVDLVIKNVAKRMWTKDYWILDPDAFICRPTLGVSDEKILELQKSIMAAEGNLFLGDDMIKLSESRITEFVMPMFENKKGGYSSVRARAGGARTL